jgi:phosphatidylglycerol:prolipoprotein diacylglycerol transferase
MRPILVNIPAKFLFAVALILAVAGFVRNFVRRRRDPGVPFDVTPVYLLAGAEAILHFRGDSWVPNAAAFARQWLPIPIYAYGVMLGTSLIVGWFLAMRLAKQDGIPQQEAGTIYMWTAVWSIIGARLLWFFTDPSPKDSIFDILQIWKGGLVAYGGMIGGFLASWYGCRKRGIPLLRWGDVAAPSVVLGTGITRIGCFLFGCDYGRVTKLPWGIKFPKGSPAWQHHVYTLKELPSTALQSLPVHPTQLYESAVGLFLFAALMLVRRYRRFSGQVFLAWVFGYGILRPIIEIVRDDDDRGVYTFGGIALSTSQIIGIVSVVLGLVLLVALLRRYRRDPEGLRLWEQPLVMAPARTAAAVASAPVTTEGKRGGGTRRRKRR